MEKLPTKIIITKYGEIIEIYGGNKK